MNTMRGVTTAICIALLIGCHNDKPHLGTVDSDHAVIEAAVASFVNSGDVYTLAETPSLSPWLTSDLKGLRARLHEIDELDHELVDSLISANGSPTVFDQNQFPQESRLRTLSEEAQKRIFMQAGDGWAIFKKEVGTDGFVTLSRPGYSADRSTALIAIWHKRHDRWQRGSFLVGDRVDGTWVFREIQSLSA